MSLPSGAVVVTATSTPTLFSIPVTAGNPAVVVYASANGGPVWADTGSSAGPAVATSILIQPGCSANLNNCGATVALRAHAPVASVGLFRSLNIVPDSTF